jgi:hypothetical protein
VGAYISLQEQGDAVKRTIIERYRHPNYDPFTLSYNVMVLKLDEKVDHLPTVWIDQLFADIPEDAELTVVGFGSTAARIQISKLDNETIQHTVLDTSEIMRYGNDDGPTGPLQGAVLQKASVTIVPHDSCDADDGYAGFIDDNTMICGGTLDDGSDICKFSWNKFPAM